ncbi:SseB family protein, partial [Actinomadura sp. NPDC048032]|uniref:SseB family protein n=1 Tax=Actinomadura sp. NPDC048032 TaxID=3155747 RepID=UPI00340393B8
KSQGVRPRVWFGERWITSVFDLFEENTRYFPVSRAAGTNEEASTSPSGSGRIQRRAANSMTVRFGDIAETWPDDRWWLAVDVPARGVPAALPIEARLPSWFVRQVADGDGRPPQVGRASPPWEELRDQHRELPREAPRPEFQPANDVERELLRAAANNDHDLFLQTLAATDVLLPVPDDMDFSLRPGRPGFPWQTREVDGSTVVPVFTSPERLVEASGPGTEHIALPFTVVLRYWPDPDWLLAINSGSPAGGTVLAQQLPGLATWADQRAAQRMTDRFEPQNDIEQRLFDAARRRDTEAFFKIILGAQVLVPVDAETPWGIVPGDPDFPWRPVRVHGRTSIQIFTSLRWMNEAIGTSRFIMPSLLEMVTAWPDASWTLVLNPGTPIDASMPGEQVRTLSGPPAPPSAATPPPPSAPSVPVAPAVPADPAASGPGRHAGPPVPDEPAVPAPVEPGRHHAGAPSGSAAQRPAHGEAVPRPQTPQLPHRHGRDGQRCSEDEGQPHPERGAAVGALEDVEDGDFPDEQRREEWRDRVVEVGRPEDVHE